MRRTCTAAQELRAIGPYFREKWRVCRGGALGLFVATAGDMLKMNTILVPVDFEEASEAAVQTAADLAARFGAKVVLMHAYELPFYPYPGVAPLADSDLPHAIREAATNGLEGLATQIAGRVPSCEHVLRTGSPAESVLAVAKEQGADLIVMGTHGRTGLAHALLGSVAQRVLRRAEVPVLTVRSPTEKAA